MKPHAATSVELPRHLHSLDALRGIAALGVVLWHWQHFFYDGTASGPFHERRQPLYGLLKPLYTDGGRAVDLFFCLSGFVFFWLYADSIGRGATSVGQFAALRFSRLYPLHFVTLLVVAAGQALMLALHGVYFVYPCNDIHHFGLQLFLASNWGFQNGYSFNYPIWSVSIEVLCYAVFFLVCRLRADNCWKLALFALTGFALRHTGNKAFAQGVLGFFAGGVTFHVFAAILRAGRLNSVVPLMAVLTAAAWMVIPYNISTDTIYYFYRESLWTPALEVGGTDVIGWVLGGLDACGFELVVFPLTIITIALWEVRRGALGRRWSFLGQLSYSTYLWHFPLQMVFAGIVMALGLSNQLFYSPWMLGLFFVVLLPLSLCSYHYFERPCQTWLRSQLLPRAGQAQNAPSNIVGNGEITVNVAPCR